MTEHRLVNKAADDLLRCWFQCTRTYPVDNIRSITVTTIIQHYFNLLYFCKKKKLYTKDNFWHCTNQIQLVVRFLPEETLVEVSNHPNSAGYLKIIVFLRLSFSTLLFIYLLFFEKEKKLLRSEHIKRVIINFATYKNRSQNNNMVQHLLNLSITLSINFKPFQIQVQKQYLLR